MRSGVRRAAVGGARPRPKKENRQKVGLRIFGLPSESRAGNAVATRRRCGDGDKTAADARLIE